MGESYVTDYMREGLQEHELFRISEKPVEAYYLKQPHSRMSSTLILFTPEGIVMVGDLTPEMNGTCSRRHDRDLAWFIADGRLEWDICDNFLKKKWLPELALKEMQQENFFEEWCENTADNRVKFDKLVEYLAEGPDGIWSEVETYQVLGDIGYDLASGVPGYGFDPGEAGWLCAIHQRFAELYTKGEIIT